MENIQKIFREIDLFDFTSFFWSELFLIFWLTVKGLKNISPNLLFNHDLHVMRIILKLQNGGDREFVELPNGKRRYFRDLMSHHKEISQSEKMHAFQSVILVLKLCLDEKNLPEKSNEVLEIYGKMVINSFEIQDNSMTEGIGQGLYLG